VTSYSLLPKALVCSSNGLSLPPLPFAFSLTAGRGTITTKVLPEGSYHGETGFLAKTVSFRASKRFSTLPTKLILTEQLSNEPSLPSSLKRQATERSVNNSSFTSKQMAAITSAITSAGATPGATPGGGSVNNHSDSFSEDEYLQSHTFLTQTFADLRYITRGVHSSYLPLSPLPLLSSLLCLCFSSPLPCLSLFSSVLSDV
jgi:hypothetical protein